MGRGLLLNQSDSIGAMSVAEPSSTARQSVRVRTPLIMLTSGRTAKSRESQPSCSVRMRLLIFRPAFDFPLTPSAYEVYTKSMYRSKEDADNDPMVLYRRISARSRSVSVEFLGVWVSGSEGPGESSWSSSWLGSVPFFPREDADGRTRCQVWVSLPAAVSA